MAIDKSNLIALHIWAVVTTCMGGYNSLKFMQVATPVVKPGEALIRVPAARMDNVEINTRLG